MQRVISKSRVLVTILYLLPILLVSVLTQKTNYFLLSAGVMTTLLSLSMYLMPRCVGYRKDLDKYHSPLFIGISGILLVLIYTMG